MPKRTLNSAGFDHVALIGVGLIGSSLSHAMRRAGLAGRITAHARSEATREAIRRLKLADDVCETAAEAVDGADLVILCTPVGAFASLAA
jgi:cyclohexadieny/prephenate dehydrogenase